MPCHRANASFRRPRYCSDALLIALALAVPAAGAEKADAKRRELSQIQRQLESTRRELDEFRRAEKALGRDLEKIEDRNAEARRKLAQLQRNVRLAEEKKSELKTRLGALGQASGLWRDQLGSDLRAYAGASLRANDACGSRELWTLALRRAALFEKVDLLARLDGFSRKTALAEAETRKKAQELLKKRVHAQEEERTIQKEAESKKAALAQTQEKAAAAQARAAELEESARALTSLLRALGGPKTSAAAAAWSVAPNSLAWPAAGRVVRGFGRQRNAELGTTMIHQGLLLETAAAAAVAAVESGRVIFAGPFRSYGRVLILDHGAGFFSVYGELGELLTAKGAQVKQGEPIARTAAAAGAAKLYLEIRRGAEALDPTAWLEKR